MTTVISATELKNKVSEVLNDVYFGGNIAIIERYGKPIVEISPVNKSKLRKMNIKEVLDATFGSLPDFPDVTKFRVSRRKKIKL